MNERASRWFSVTADAHLNNSHIYVALLGIICIFAAHALSFQWKWLREAWTSLWNFDWCMPLGGREQMRWIGNNVCRPRQYIHSAAHHQWLPRKWHNHVCLFATCGSSTPIQAVNLSRVNNHDRPFNCLNNLTVNVCIFNAINSRSQFIRSNMSSYIWAEF